MKRKVWALAVLMLTLTQFTYCQASDEDDDLVALERIVVTPYRYEETLGKTPASVTVINPGEIEKSSAQTVIDVLRPTSGLTVRDYYGNGVTATVDMAGFGDAAALNVLVLIDGRRVNSVDLSGVDWSQIPLDQVERIEVIRGGSAGVLYGDNASSGVINIITKKGRGKPKMNLQAEYGSYSMNKEKLSLNGGINNKFSYWLSGGWESTNGYRHNTYNRASDFSSKIGYDLNDKFSLNFSSGFHASTYGMPGALFQHHIDEFNRRYARYGEDHADDKDYYFVLGQKLKLLGLGQLSVDFNFRRKETNSYFLTSNNPTRKNKISTFGVTPKYTLSNNILEHENKLVAGFDYYRTFYNSDQYFTSDENILKELTRIHKTSLGSYLQDEFSLTKRLVLVAGYRDEFARYAFNYHDADTIDFGHPYPDQEKKVRPQMRAFNAGLVYNYKDDSSIFFDIGKSFRFPEVDEFTFQDSNFQQQLNTDLKPQSAINYQAGVRHKMNSNLRISLSLFRMHVKDELYFNPNGGPFAFGQNENYDKTVHEGLETSLDTKLNKWINFFGNYTFTNSFFKDGQYDKNIIPMVPRHKGSVGLRLSLQKSLTFNATGTYVGKRYFINDTSNAFSRLNGYMVTDTNLTWSRKDLSVALMINNLFDKKYSEYGVYGFDSSTFIMDKAYYPNPGRNFTLKVDYKF